MSKTKIPFFSFRARGTIGDTLTTQKRGSSTLIRSKPTPTDPNSLNQQYQRWDYQDYVAWWHNLTAAQREAYRSAATKQRLTIFQYWIKYNLTDLPDLAGRWRLDTLAGAIARDSSRNSNDGVVYGATDVAGVIDHACHFDGIDDSINCGRDTSITSIFEAFTFLGFIRFTGQVGSQTIMSIGLPGAGTNCGISYWGGTNFFYAFVYGGANCTIANPLINTWHHFGVTWEKVNAQTKVSSFFEGLPIATITSTELTDLSGGDLEFGRRLGSYPLNADLDHLELFNRILTPSDIQRHSERRYP